jgi:hypothetical protein
MEYNPACDFHTSSGVTQLPFIMPVKKVFKQINRVISQNGWLLEIYISMGEIWGWMSTWLVSI